MGKSRAKGGIDGDTEDVERTGSQPELIRANCLTLWLGTRFKVHISGVRILFVLICDGYVDMVRWAIFCGSFGGIIPNGEILWEIDLP
jgi:hypothetical protein